MNYDLHTDGVEPIALVGMAARVPGAADIGQFWRNLVDGAESITFYTREEQLALGVTEDELDDPSWVSAAPVIDGVELFDAELFGMTAREAELTNPQHRLFLEASHTALEDAGYDPGRYGGAIGVYAGTGADHYQWTNLYRNAKLWRAAAGNLGVSSGNYPDYVATLVSYKLDLRGPSLTVHTACSTSLVAVHLAAEALRNAECDMALAGGVCIELPHGRGYQGMEGYTSPDGHCRPFDARANGTLWGSGVGVAVLKRLSDAIADGDHIRAVLLGNAINNDGSAKVGFSAPSIEGQAEAVAQALAAAAIDPRTIGYVEAHGTGTALGDPIEVAALSQVYTGGVADRQWCGIGSVKSNLGHLSQAAGIVGMVKAVLAMEHGLIPPTINFEILNPAIDIEDSPFYIATMLSKWDANGSPRRAAVSSFGIGGTNAHMILQEAPAIEPPPRENPPANLLRLSAATPDALTAMAQRLAAHLDENPDLHLADVAHTLHRGRAEHTHRAAVVAADPEAAAEALRDPRRLHTGIAADPPPRVALLLSGQGSQYAGMGAQLYRSEPVFANAVDECAGLLDLDVRSLMFDPGSEASLLRTEHTQPALFVLEYALAQLWRSWGVEPVAMIGHSIGEYVAATLAGVFQLPDALALVATRGRLMQSMPAGSMLAVQLDEADVARRLPDGLAIATVNGPGTCVVSGPADTVGAFAKELKAHGIGSKALRTSHAFHSPMMEPILDEFAAAVAAVPRQAPQLRVLSNLSGDWLTAAQATDPRYWADHLRHTVRFGACVATLLRAEQTGLVLLECGPGRQLCGLARMQLPRSSTPPLQSLPAKGEPAGDLATAYQSAGALWAAGVPIGQVGEPGRRVALPTYPYQRRRHWVEPDPDFAERPAGSRSPARKGPLPLDEWFAVPTWRQLPAGRATAGTAAPTSQPTSAMVFVAGPSGAALAEALRSTGAAVTEVRPAQASTRADYEALVAAGVPERIVHAWALDGEPAGADVDAGWQAQDLGFFSVLYLAQALAARDAADPVRLDIVSAGTEDVLGTELTRPEHATLNGLARVLPLELPWLTVHRFDVIVGEDPHRLLTELTSDGDHGAEPWQSVALRSGRRWVAGFEQVPSAPAADAPAVLRERGRYLITGGLGGIGLTVAEDLAQRYGARLVLLSRSGLPPREQWDAHLTAFGTRTARAITAIRRMERAGATVHVVAADVTDPADLHRVRALVDSELNGLDGIVHAAGLPGGGMAEVKERAAAVAVLAPKLAGTLALRQAFGGLELDFVALCSSVTGIAGGLGQVDYCAANAFLDAYARSDHGWGCRVISLNWGAWLEVGMAAAAGPLPLGEIEHPVLRRRAQSACWGLIEAGTHWVLDEHRIAGVGVMPGTGHLECARAAIAACLPPTAGPAAGSLIELRDVVFTEPLAVPDGSLAEYRVELDGGEFSVVSRTVEGSRTVHAQGSGGWVPAEPVARLDLDAVKARCKPVEGALGDPFRTGGGRVSMLTFGPRWGALREAHAGEREELALVEAPAQAEGDLGEWVLHPALLDVATSFGSRGEGSYLPLSYGRVLVRGRLPGRFYSHLRYRADEPGVLTADLTLVDESGAELVAISEFVLRKVDTGTVSGNIRSNRQGRPAERGIRPADGAEAFRRAVTADLGPQVVINTETVADLLARARRTTSETVADDPAAAPATPGTAALAVAAGNGDANFAAPSTEVEITLARVWMETLGVERVGRYDDFFALGGNSLVAVQLIAQIRKATGVRLPMRSLFETPTVHGLAERIEQLRKTKPATPAEATTIPKLDRSAP